jgi:hypothetical protein
MSRRKTDFLSLSFLDVLTSGLGAFIFIFIISPKGETTPPPVPTTVQNVLYIDSSYVFKREQPFAAIINRQFMEMLLGSSKHPNRENTKSNNPVNANLLNTKVVPSVKVDKSPKSSDSMAFNRPFLNPCSIYGLQTGFINASPRRTNAADSTFILPKTEEKLSVSPSSPSSPSSKETVHPTNPCKVAFEIKWGNQLDNVDLYVYKGNEFVCGRGGLRINKSIGEWDSGRSRNRLFGSDLRTNQEAVRQFNGISAGEYKLFAHFKETARLDSIQNVHLTGLIYTVNEGGEKQSKIFNAHIPLSKKDKLCLGTVQLNADGSFSYLPN